MFGFKKKVEKKDEVVQYVYDTNDYFYGNHKELIEMIAPEAYDEYYEHFTTSEKFSNLIHQYTMLKVSLSRQCEKMMSEDHPDYITILGYALAASVRSSCINSLAVHAAGQGYENDFVSDFIRMVKMQDSDHFFKMAEDAAEAYGLSTDTETTDRVVH